MRPVYLPTPRFGLSPSLSTPKRKKGSCRESIRDSQGNWIPRKTGERDRQGLPSVHSVHKAFIPMDETLSGVAVTLEIYCTVSKQKNPGIKPFNAIMDGNASNKYGIGEVALRCVLTRKSR
jgi:hypothetical protein